VLLVWTQCCSSIPFHYSGPNSARHQCCLFGLNAVLQFLSITLVQTLHIINAACLDSMLPFNSFPLLWSKQCTSSMLLVWTQCCSSIPFHYSGPNGALHQCRLFACKESMLLFNSFPLLWSKQCTSSISFVCLQGLYAASLLLAITLAHTVPIIDLMLTES